MTIAVWFSQMGSEPMGWANIRSIGYGQAWICPERPTGGLAAWVQRRILMAQGCATPQGVRHICRRYGRMDAELYTSSLQGNPLAMVEVYELDWANSPSNRIMTPMTALSRPLNGSNRTTSMYRSGLHTHLTSTLLNICGNTTSHHSML
jgi:hypothetical protein